MNYLMNAATLAHRSGQFVVTAVGLAFIGATDDSRCRAFDMMTGKQLSDLKLPATASTGPISYRGRDGRKLVAVVATGGNNAGVPATTDDVIAIGLPKRGKSALNRNSNN